MAQFLRPVAATSNSGFATHTGATDSASLTAALDESSPDDADYIASTGGTIRYELGAGTDPNLGTGHILRIRTGKMGPDVVDGTVRLIQGASTVIAERLLGDVLTNATTLTLVLTEDEANAITDYAGPLYVEIEVSTLPELGIYDTFTDTTGVLLTAHTSDSGHSWLVHPVHSGAGSPVISQWGSARKGNVAATQVAVVDADVASPNVRVRAKVLIKSTGGNFVGLCLRVHPTADTMYHMRTDQAGSEVELYLFNNGTPTLLDSGAWTWTDEQTYDFEFEADGDLLRGYVNGTLVVEATNSAIPDAGGVGVRFGGTATGGDFVLHHITELRADHILPGEYVRLDYNGIHQTALSPSVVYDATNNRTVVGSVGREGGLGHIVVTEYDHDTGIHARYHIGDENDDDHNVPTVRLTSGRRPVAVWTGHNVSTDMKLVVGTVDDIASLVPATIQTITFPAVVSYNMFYRIESLSDASQDTYWVFTRVDTAGWYVCQFSVNHATGAVTQDWIRQLMSGDFVYLLSAEAENGSGHQIIRIATFWNPLVTASTNHYIELNAETGAIASPVETLTANLITNTGLPLDADTLVPVLPVAPAGINRPAYGVRPGPDNPQILYVTYDSDLPNDAEYFVYDLNSDTSTSLGMAGTPFLAIPDGVVRLPGMSFPQPSSDGSIFRITGNGTLERVDLLTPDGSGGYDVTPIMTRDTADGRIARPVAPLNGGPFRTVVANMTSYNNYDDWQSEIWAVRV